MADESMSLDEFLGKSAWKGLGSVEPVEGKLPAESLHGPLKTPAENRKTNLEAAKDMRGRRDMTPKQQAMLDEEIAKLQGGDESMSLQDFLGVTPAKAATAPKSWEPEGAPSVLESVLRSAKEQGGNVATAADFLWNFLPGMAAIGAAATSTAVETGHAALSTALGVPRQAPDAYKRGLEYGELITGWATSPVAKVLGLIDKYAGGGVTAENAPLQAPLKLSLIHI